jgi:hypothetical protein
MRKRKSNPMLNNCIHGKGQMEHDVAGLTTRGVLGSHGLYVLGLAPTVSPLLECIAKTSSPEVVD